MLLRIFSTEVAVREEDKETLTSKALTKQLSAGVPVHESNKLEGKSVRLVQLYQDCWKVVPLDTSTDGKLVRLWQSRHVAKKFVPLEVSINGKLVRLEQKDQVELKFVPAAVLINGKLVRLVQ